MLLPVCSSSDTGMGAACRAHEASTTAGIPQEFSAKPCTVLSKADICNRSYTAWLVGCRHSPRNVEDLPMRVQQSQFRWLLMVLCSSTC
jgi:hypothetical protein